MNNKEMFFKIDEILLQSLKPSDGLKKLINEGYFDKEPFNKIKKLKDIDQPKKYHPEGSVLNHIFLVVDLASEYKKYSRETTTNKVNDTINNIDMVTNILKVLE